jgi:hypothetical protein
MVKPFVQYDHYTQCKLSYKGPIGDPSDGSGAILDYLTEDMRVPKKDVLALEINPDLVYTLQGKEYRVVGRDFLGYDEPGFTFGTIFMNPPFSGGVKHVLKAWDLLADGGSMAALLSAESLKNPCHKERQTLLTHMAKMIDQVYVPGDESSLLKALEGKGHLEWLGSAFKNAERPTNVGVALIRMKKPERKTIDFSGIGFDTEDKINDPGFSENPLAHVDAIKNLVARYNTARRTILEREESQSKLNFYLDGIYDPVCNREESQSKLNFYLDGIYDPVCNSADRDASLEQKISLNDQLMILRSRFWNTVFTKTKLGSKTTSDFQKKFSDFAATQAAMAFTEDNIKEVLAMFFLSRGQIMKDCLVQVFDKATAYHEKNQIHSEGWKTNKSYRLNKRIIMPNAMQWEDCFGLRISGARDFLGDLDKVMSWLTGIDLTDHTSTYEAIEKFCRIHGKTNYQQSFESVFFNLRCYKKGTLHIDFKDLKTLERFNQIAAEGKKWIGGGY